jgi:hypothetical protein
VSRVSEAEVLLLWRALVAFRSGPAPACRAGGNPPTSPCPLHARCPRWQGPDDYRASLEETPEETERRRSAWPCSRLLDVLAPDVNDIGRH